MENWSKWYDKEEANTYPPGHGIYQICIVDKEGRAIPIPRIGGTDEEGIIYIGRSSILENRIWEFLHADHHSGSVLYRLACPVLRKLENFDRHRLQFRVMYCEESQIKNEEKNALKIYFDRYCEPPPYNSRKEG